jgi:hypothetical protein
MVTGRTYHNIAAALTAPAISNAHLSQAQSKDVPVYRRHTLASDSKNIRVVEVLHNHTVDPNAPISCKLHVVSLDDVPSYKALSYVWGDEARLKTMFLDGQPFSVRENLFNFLAQYRSNGDTGYLWIDAICIDQSCIQERNHQVALMGSVYSTADMVIAWLGSNLDLAYAIVTLKHHEKFVDKQLAHALHQVCNNNYWSRLWIVQEFVLGQTLQVWSGYARIDGQAFCELFSQRLHNLRSTVTDAGVILLLDKCYLSNTNTVATYRFENKRMDGFWNDFISSECSDRRDSIYGLLGVLSEKQKWNYTCKPDYSKPVNTLYMDVWIMWLKSMLYEHTSEREGTWWLMLGRYATRLEKRLRLTRGEDAADYVRASIQERRDMDLGNNCSLIEHVQELLVLAEGKLVGGYERRYPKIVYGIETLPDLGFLIRK